MAKKYKYKNIDCYETCGRWSADYVVSDKRLFTLHNDCCATKKRAYELAKKMIDYLNKED